MQRQASQQLKYSVIRDKLESLLKALDNLLDRSFPKNLIAIKGFKTFLALSLKSATTIHESIRYLSADVPKDPTRKLEFGLVTGPLVRSLADILFNIVFLLEDIPVRTDWFHKGSWREMKEDYERHKATYGTLPEWQGWLNERGEYLEESRKVFGISTSEASNLKSLRYWPNPGQMVNSNVLTAQGKDFLQYANAWLYKGLSSDSHVSGAGLVRRYAALIIPDEELKRDQLVKLKSDNVFTATTLIVSICTEINDVCQFDRREAISYLWRILAEHWGEAEDLYRKRYEFILGKA